MSRVAGWPPRWLSAVSLAERRRGDGDQYADFVEAVCRITKDSFAGRTGELIRVRGWQRELQRHLLARRKDGRRLHRQALVGMPRKNGKSALGASLGLGGLVLEANGAEVYSCAGDREQARIVFGMARRMVELDEELSELCTLYRDAIEVKSTGSIYRVLSAEAFTKEGLSPTLVVFDEVHVQPSDELWNVMTLGSGARVDPLVLGITTAGSRVDSNGQDTLCYRLYQHGRRVATGEVSDPSFFFAWWEPIAGTEADHTDPKVWKESNPGYGDLVDPEDFESTVRRTPEPEYRTKRTNVWVISSSSAFPHRAWDMRAVKLPRAVTAADGAVLFVDGSWNGDSTGIVGCTADQYLFTVGCWERPLDDQHWRVPIADVKATIIREAKRLGARWVAFDPYRWQATMQELEDEGVPVMEFPTNSVPRIVPAWKSFYDAVMDGTLTHDGDPRLARHVENMRLKIDAQGVRPMKEHKSSNRHIDLGICAVGAHAIRALPSDPAPPTPMFAFV